MRGPMRGLLVVVVVMVETVVRGGSSCWRPSGSRRELRSAMAAKTAVDSGPRSPADTKPMARRHGALQIRFSERRALLMVGDIAATITSVVIGLFLWAQRA